MNTWQTTRRLTLAVGAAVMAGVLAACGGNGSSGSGAQGKIDTDAVYKSAYPAPPTGMDPHTAATSVVQLYTNPIYDRLTEVGNDLQPKPMLATSWTFSDDGKKLTLKLRSDVKFHDGTPFDAEAVKVNLDRARTAENSSVAFYLSAITSVNVVDATTVELALDGQGAGLPVILGTNAGAMVSPKVIKEAPETLKTDPGNAGSGPYVVTKYDPNSGVEYKRAPNYWNPDIAKVAGFSYAYIPKASTRLTGVQSGQLNGALILGSDIPQAEKLVESGAMAGARTDSINLASLFFRANRPPLDNKKVREAIQYAIDRETIAKQLLAGALVSHQPYPKDHWAHNEALKSTFTYDPAKAKQLLSEAGVSGKVSFELTYAAGSSTESSAKAIQEQLKQVGIEVKLTPKTFAELTPGFSQGGVDAMITVANAQVDPALWVRFNYLGNYALAKGQPEEKKIIELLEKGDAATATPEERAAAFKEIWKVGQDASWMAPFAYTPGFLLTDKNTVGVDSLPGAWNGLIDMSRVGLTAK